jgi:hypothetical protein
MHSAMPAAHSDVSARKVPERRDEKTEAHPFMKPQENRRAFARLLHLDHFHRLFFSHMQHDRQRSLATGIAADGKAESIPLVHPPRGF